MLSLISDLLEVNVDTFKMYQKTYGPSTRRAILMARGLKCLPDEEQEIEWAVASFVRDPNAVSVTSKLGSEQQIDSRGVHPNRIRPFCLGT